MDKNCPECGASWQDGQTCQDHFHQMLYWENENPALGEVHHLAVLCYHLQHPGLLSAEWLAGAKSLLADFIERGVQPAEVRKRDGAKLSSENRGWTIRATSKSQGAYEHPMEWSIRAGDIIKAGMSRYPESITTWAHSIHQTIQQTDSEGNFND